MTDLTKVDPAVLESHATAGAPSASPGVEAHPKVVRPAAPPAYFPVSASCVLKTEDGKFPLVDQKTSVVLLCTDEKHVSVPLKSVDAIPVIRELVAAAPLPAEQPPTEEGAAPVAPVRPVVTVPLPSGAVIAINHWIEKKGVKGESTSKFAKPIVHVELPKILDDDWEIDFVQKVLVPDDVHTDTLFATLKFAETQGLPGLYNFCIAALSCVIRGKSDEHMLASLHVGGDSMTDEQLSAAKAAYPWLEAAIAPK